MALVAKLTTEIVLSTLFATTATLRTLSRATPEGPFPTGIVAPMVTGGDTVKSTSVKSFDPLFATTATPVAVFTAIAAGLVPPSGRLAVVTLGCLVGSGLGVHKVWVPMHGCTAKFTV